MCCQAGSIQGQVWRNFFSLKPRFFPSLVPKMLKKPILWFCFLHSWLGCQNFLKCKSVEILENGRWAWRRRVCFCVNTSLATLTPPDNKKDENISRSHFAQSHTRTLAQAHTHTLTHSQTYTPTSTLSHAHMDSTQAHSRTQKLSSPKAFSAYFSQF